MAKKEIVIGVKVEPELSGIRKLKTELRDVKDQIADAMAMDNIDPSKIQALTARAGELKDQMVDINEQVNIMASGSKFEAMGKSIGDVGGKIMSLDFEGAKESANKLITLSKGLTFGDAIKGVKDLGSTFIQLGRALLANPLFLLAAVIIGLVIVIVKIMDKIGLLKVITNALGKVFEWLMIPINAIIDGLKALTDWFGWTANAATDSAAQQAEAAEGTAVAYENKAEKVTMGYDHEIKMAEIAGTSTREAELKKAYFILATAKARAKADIAAYQSAKLTGDLDAKELADLKKKYDASVNAATDASNSITEMKAGFRAEDKKNAIKDQEEIDKAAEDAAEKAKAAGEKARAAAKQYASDRLSARRQTEDLTLALMDEGIDKEIKANKIKYDRLIEDTKSSEKLLKTEKDAIVKMLTEQSTEAETKLRVDAEKKKNDEILAAQKEFRDLMISLDQNTYSQQMSELNNKQEEEVTKLKEQLDNELLTKQQYDAALIALEADKQAQLDELKGGGKDAETPAQKAQSEAEALIEIERLKMEASLITEQEFADRKAAINEDLSNKLKAMDEASAAAGIKSKQAQLAEIGTSINSLGNLMSAINEAEIAGAEGNEEKQEALRKKGFEQNKKFQIASATIAGIQGVINALTAVSTIPEPFGSILKGVNAGIVAGTTAANISKIRSTQYGGGPAPTPPPPPASPGGSVPTSAAPSINLFGQGNNQNTQGANGTQNGSTTLNITNEVSVSESEITGTQKKIQKLENNSTL